MKYPEITVKLVDRDANAFSIIGAVIRGLKCGGVESEEVDKFTAEAMSGTYDNLLRTCSEWVNIE